MSLDFSPFSEKLADIREKIISAVKRINTAAGGEPFYGRFLLAEDKRIAGLISELGVNGYKILFILTEERLVKKKISRRISRKKISFENIRGIDIFKTLSGKPIFIEK